MWDRSSALFVLAFAGALAGASPVMPQEVDTPCRLCGSEDGRGEPQPAKPVSLDVEAGLDFDRLILFGQGNGTAELGPDGARLVSGSVGSIGMRAMVGEVVVRGEPGRAVRVMLPDSIALYGLAGGSLKLDSIRSDLPSLPRLDGDGNLRFRFGGAVQIIGDVDGDFRGNVPVEVEYL